MEAIVEPIVLRRVRTFAHALGILEGWLSVLSGAAVALMGFIALMSVFCQDEIPPAQLVGAGIWAVGWLFLDVPYLTRILLIAIRGRRPFALKAAIYRPMYPMLFRPIIALWWFSHFAFGAMGTSMMHANNGVDRETHLSLLPVQLSLGLAANGFLMLSVCALTSSARIRMGVWKSRVLVDVAFIFIGAQVAVHLHVQPNSARPLRSPTGIAAIGR